MFSNTRSKVRATILHDDTLTPDNRRRFERTAERFGQAVDFLDVGERVFDVTANPDSFLQLTRGTLFRLLLPELLPDPRVIYLDCDVVVNLDIAELWALRPEDAGLSLAAVKDSWVSRYRVHGFRAKLRNWVMGHAPQEYFNAGVLLMNFARIRERHNLLKESREFFERYNLLSDDADQDFLNTAFRGDVMLVDGRFNDFYGSEGRYIMHFAGRKPWKLPAHSPRDALFWKTLMDSEWGSTVVDRLLGILYANSERAAPLSTRSSKALLKLALACVRSLVSRALHRVFPFRFSLTDWRALFKELRFRYVLRRPVPCASSPRNSQTKGA
jgi:lipopolysaccharide biosynthesis glycosyltransferase